jgi:phosphoglycerate dehydrogenase-like enzyme
LSRDVPTAGKAHTAPTLAFAFGPFGTDRLFAPEDLQRLDRRCRIASLDPLPNFTADDARSRLAETEILVTGWGCPLIDSAVLAAAPNLRLIAHAAGSVKHLITPEAFARGVIVTNAADANAVSVAEFTLAAVLFANKQVFRFRRDYSRQRAFMALHESFEGSAGNWRKSVGIVGASRIGRRVIELLRPHEIDILLHDPFVDADEAARMGVVLMPLEELMGRCDTVSVHAPLLPVTRNLIDADMLARMPDGATIINTARGGLIDGAALEAELVSGRLWAILDVTEPETPAAASPLYTLENVVLTPHIAGAIGTERQRLGRLITDEIERYLTGQPLRHAVTIHSLEHQA